MFALIVCLLVFISMYVHEGFHYLTCILIGGHPIFYFWISPERATQDLGLFGIIGAPACSCSIQYWNVYVREAIAYAGQLIFVAVTSIVAFKLVVLS